MQYDIHAQEGEDLSIDFVCRDPRPGYTTTLGSARLDVLDVPGGEVITSWDSATDAELAVNGERVELRVPSSIVDAMTQEGVYALDVTTTLGANYNPFNGAFILESSGE